MSHLLSPTLISVESVEVSRLTAMCSVWQHIDKMFKHKELQQQLMDTKLQRITEMMKEVEEKQQKERDLVSLSSLLRLEQARRAGVTVNGVSSC